EVVTSGQYGRVELARLWRRVIVPAGGWFLDGRISGGAILDLHIHDVDAALWIFGAPAAMSAFGRKGPSGGYDQVEAVWHYGDDRLVVLEGLWFKSAPSAFEMGFDVAMEKATVSYSTARKPDLQVNIPGQEPIIPSLSSQDGYWREIDCFVRAILNDRPIERAAPESSRLSVALVESEIASIESRGRIDIGPKKRTR
ncbi:hypothetical protein FJY63_14940, partial [Candidatus Sumerlaeota bacterium]|nr:hypothetical protein [Candidatus Sumerlaeota bacterium]